MKEISFKKFLYEEISEVWSYEIWSYIFTYILVGVFLSIINPLIMFRDDALTTSNFFYVMFSPQGILIAILMLVMVLIYVCVEFFGEIIFIGKLYNADSDSSFFSLMLHSLKEAIESLKLFLNVPGILWFIYLLIISPLVGAGFTISLTDDLTIPNFILEVITKTPAYIIPLITFTIVMMIFGVLHIFTFHGVLLNKEKPVEAMRHSREIIKKNWKNFLFRLIRLMVIMFIIRIVIYIITYYIPLYLLDGASKTLPKKYIIDFGKLSNETQELSDLDIKVLLLRIAYAVASVEGEYITVIVKLLTDACFMLFFTKFYLEYSAEYRGKKELVYEERTKRKKYRFKVITCVLIGLLFAILATFIALGFEDFRNNGDDIVVVAHRTGGNLASENSIDGLKVAIERGCYGAETDVQRTKDGYYIINHDDTFKRLAGVDKASQDMTLAEIRELKIEDTTGSGKILQVPTLEEFLDVIKGKIILYIELKGATADRKMADDVVRIVKEKGCEKDVVIISLKYDVMQYIEEKYSDIETGLLCFGGVGDVPNLKVNQILMEEEMAKNLISAVAKKNKTAGIWTVNTESGMRTAFNMDADAIITDDVILFERVQAEKSTQSDYEAIEDMCRSIFGY